MKFYVHLIYTIVKIFHSKFDTLNLKITLAFIKNITFNY
jgi:hypothetical protein